MQNQIVMLCVAFVLQLCRGCLGQLAGSFALIRSRPGKSSLGAFSPSVDLDSARLDVVSRSLWWGAGLPVPERAPARVCPPIVVPRRVRWQGGPPDAFGRWDH